MKKEGVKKEGVKKEVVKIEGVKIEDVKREGVNRWKRKCFMWILILAVKKKPVKKKYKL
ncbi:MAG: hypothetical protein HXK86_06175 [Lachnospiraceae bacterium]|nr:hypothetical protein [Lachnospiraceae bacterium]